MNYNEKNNGPEEDIYIYIYRNYKHVKTLLPSTGPDFMTLALKTEAESLTEYW